MEKNVSSIQNPTNSSGAAAESMPSTKGSVKLSKTAGFTGRALALTFPKLGFHELSWTRLTETLALMGGRLETVTLSLRSSTRSLQITRSSVRTGLTDSKKGTVMKATAKYVGETNERFTNGETYEFTITGNEVTSEGPDGVVSHGPVASFANFTDYKIIEEMVVEEG